MCTTRMIAVTGSKHGNFFLNLAFVFFVSILFLLLELSLVWIRVRVITISCIFAIKTLSSS